MKIIPLSEGVFTIGHDKIFHAFDQNTHVLNERAVGSLLVEIQPFLLQWNGRNILFDTGLGFKLPDGTLQIHHNLQQHGLAANDIHAVILSHLHKDHAGGISYENESGMQTLSFPNATYFVSKREFEYAVEKGAPSYVTEDFEILKNAPQTEWLDEKGSIYGLISYEEDGGHCPYHTSFLLAGEGEHIFYGGDVVPQLKQLKIKYVAKYDYDGKRSMELRQQYAERGKQAHWKFLFYH
ncbi:MAG: MBL fold metallo-hydrolase, partial [Chitinophagaceae bacterium]|nr:MBL fold metallo-hydrolase [Chitinophagaceae bacterium]